MLEWCSSVQQQYDLQRAQLQHIGCPVHAVLGDAAWLRMVRCRRAQHRSALCSGVPSAAARGTALHCRAVEGQTLCLLT